MDLMTIDQNYQQLQAQSQTLAQAFQALAGKLGQAADGGNQQAREWQLDLREIAVNLRDHEAQMAGLLQNLHGYFSSAQSSVPAAPGTYPAQAPYPQGGLAPAAPQGGFMGMVGGLLNSGFGRAMEMGAGFAIGDDLINSIF